MFKLINDGQKNQNTIILLFHKTLSKTDGQVNYVKTLISALQPEYKIFLPSEELFSQYSLNNKSWVLRVLLLNFLLSRYLIKNRVELKQGLKYVIIEDRYLPFPAYLSRLFLKKPMIYRVSDWGIEYAKSLRFSIPLLKPLYVAFSYQYQISVKRHANAVIIPSEHLINGIYPHMAGKVAVFPYVPILPSPVPSSEWGELDEVNLKNTVNCIFLGNFNYKPNIDAARFIIQKIAPSILNIDADVLFLIVGPKGDEIFTKKPIPNVLCTGFIEDVTSLLKKCHIGLNLSIARGGTSIKNIDYIVNGLFVISTPEAAEGVIRSDMLTIVKQDNFSEAIVSIVKQIRKDYSVEKNEVERVRNYYSFERNRKKIIDFLKTI